MNTLLRIVLLSSLVLASGCGGGGGAGGAAAPPPAPSPSVAVGAATELDASIDLSFNRPALGIAAGGDAIAVWGAEDSLGQRRVAARRYTTQGWSNVEFIDVRIPSNQNQNATMPQIAMNTSGQAVVAWVQSDGTLNNGAIADAGSIWVSSFSPDTRGWSMPEQLSEPTSTLVILDFPSVAINESGTAFVLWGRASDANAVNTTMFIRRRPTRLAMWDTQTILDDTATEKREPKVIVDNVGNAQAFWRHYTTRDPINFDVFDLMARRFSANAWQDSIPPLATVNENVNSYVDAAMIGIDEAVVSWDQYDPVTDGVITQARAYDDRGWGMTSDDLGVGYFSSSRLAADGAGAVLVQVPADDIVVAARFYRPASGWSAARLLDDPLTISGSPVVAANVAGQVMAVWPRINDISFELDGLYANYFDGNNWQTNARLLAGSAQDVPVDIKLDANGNAIVLWLRGTGSGIGGSVALWANRFSLP